MPGGRLVRHVYTIIVECHNLSGVGFVSESLALGYGLVCYVILKWVVFSVKNWYEKCRKYLYDNVAITFSIDIVILKFI